MNAGIKHPLAQGAEFIALLNPDTIVHPDWLTALVKALEGQHAAASAQSLLLYAQDREKTNSAGNNIHFLGFGYSQGNGQYRSIILNEDPMTSGRSEESPTNVGSHPREILPTNAIGGQNDKTMRMLFVGSLDRAHWFKGLEVLLRAFVILKQEKEQNHLNSVHLNPALNTTIAANPACAGSPARAGRRLGLNLKCLVVGEGDLKEKYIKMSAPEKIKQLLKSHKKVRAMTTVSKISWAKEVKEGRAERI